MANAKLTSKAASAIAVGTRSAFRSVARTSLLMRKQLWIWPILAALLLAVGGRWLSGVVESAMRERRVAELTAILNADVAALNAWMAEQAVNAKLIAGDEQLLPLVEQLLALNDSKSDKVRALIQAPEQAALRARLSSRLELCGYVGYFVVSPAGIVIAADQEPPVGKQLGGYRQRFFEGVMANTASVSKPYRSPLLLADEQGELKANLPTMLAAARLTNKEGRPIAALGLRIPPEKNFTRILQVARSGDTGETYAFDRNGVFLSQSRFDDQLKQAGLLADLPDSRSILTLELRDPGVDMIAGNRPEKRRSDQPLTHNAAEAVAGNTGHDVDGYRDYRGVPVIGAWTWLPEYDFGVATEVDLAEAFRPLYILRRAFRAMFALLILAAVAIFVFTLVVARANREARRAAMEAKRLGQYQLDEKLGEGGMGVVYRAHHAMLHRPTAVKLLSLDKTNEQTLARFEREVQQTSRLNHPNTIAIYDYGRTPEGIFYYAMEYLEGINLEDLVRNHGPQCDGRVVFILRQICGSLAEAHGLGLIHRDIKPANIMLTERGGLRDFVKVLDFGLVKALDSKKESSLTATGTFTGTPLYMSPEAIRQGETIDARSDLYAVGAVGYYLLTGSPVFDGASVIEVLQKHISQAPESCADRLGRAVCPALEAAILKCLAKEPSHRPQTAEQLADALARCAVESDWSFQAAAQWWRNVQIGDGSTSGHPSTTDQRFAATQVLES